MTHAILVIEDEARLASNIKLYLERYDYDVQIAETGAEALETMGTFKPDIILLDYHLPGITGLEFLARLHAIKHSAKVIMITAHGNTQIAVDAMKAGAIDYLTKPLSLADLQQLIARHIKQEHEDKVLTYKGGAEDEVSGMSRLLGDSVPMRRLKERIVDLIEIESQLAGKDVPAVLITGETGTGKELVAQAIHFDGPRKNKPFIEINCASIPSHLLESELFGYERGAFTDAKERKLGLVEAANGGTLFLDEIGDVCLETQAKLLKFLEDKMVRRLGGLRDQKVNVRIIAATNRPLQTLVQDRQFRSDLYFRLKVVSIELPPLHARQEDILVLAAHFLESNKKCYGKSQLCFSDQAKKVLQQYSWPGNVRELSNVIEQAVLLSRADVILPEQLALSHGLAGRESPEENSQHLHRKLMPSSLLYEGGGLKEVERKLIIEALENCDWNISKAARCLGLSRDTLRYRIDKHKLKSPL